MGSKRDIFDWHLDDPESMRRHLDMKQTVVDALGKLYSGGYAGAPDVDAEQMDREFYAAFGCADEVEYVQAVEDDPSLDRSVKFDGAWRERKRALGKSLPPAARRQQEGRALYV